MSRRRAESALRDDYEMKSLMLADVDESIRNDIIIIRELEAIIDRFVKRVKRENMPQNDFLDRYHDYMEALYRRNMDLRNKKRHRTRLHQSLMGVVETVHF